MENKNCDYSTYMRQCIEYAKKAASRGEVPVGACVVDPEGTILSFGRNRREEERSALCHAEMEAIDLACKKRNDWRLEGCTLFVTLEPCPMCAGAVINSRISTLVYGAKDPYAGCCGSVLDLFFEKFPHHPAVYGGILEEECSSLLTSFFKEIRTCTNTSMRIPNRFLTGCHGVSDIWNR